MNVIGHDHEFVHLEFLLIAVVREGVDQELRVCLPPKDRTALGSDCGDEEDAVDVHPAMVADMTKGCR